MLFDDCIGLLRVLVLGTCAYLALVTVLRVSGKRTLAKMNAFDLVVTVALGSTLATVLLSKDVMLAEGVLAFSLLVALQYAIAWLSVRFRPVEKLAKSSPRALLLDGAMLKAAMGAERVTDGEVLAAIRSAGLGDPALSAAVVLETDGTFSVIPREKLGSGAALPKGTDR